MSEKGKIFYFPLTRMWELAAGIGLAYLESFGLFNPHRLARGIRHALSILGLLLIVVPMALKYGVRHHPGAITLAPVLGSVMIIAANVEACVNRTLLAWRPMRFVGLISYSLYLWHWPLLAFLFICVPEASGWLRTLALLIGFVISTLVYLFVENPMRRSSYRIVALILLALLVISFVAGQYLSFTKGLPSRPVAREMAAVSAVRTPYHWDIYNKAKCYPYHGLSLRVTDEVTEVPQIVFAGDSHTSQYFSAMQMHARRVGTSAAMIALSGATGFMSVYDPNHKSKEAPAFQAVLKDPRVKTVVLASKWGSYFKNPRFERIMGELLRAFKKRPDLKVFVLLDQPWTEEHGREGITDPLRHFNRLRGADAEQFIIDIPKSNAWRDGNKAVQRVLGDRARYIDVTPYVCPQGKCNLLKWYSDDDHMQPLSLTKYGAWLREIFEP